MTILETIIKQSINPFDTVSFKQGNFWEEEQSEEINVNSIHQDEIQSIETNLDQVGQDKTSRTILLQGDSGSGKTHLLGQIKKKFSNKAFFAHIIASIQNEYIFQYTLRKTVESLMFIPEGEKRSQLLLWLKQLLSKQNRGLVKKILSERKLFVNNMKAAYPSGIWNPNSFFNVLYSLTQSELYPLACGWLKGDDLDDDDLKQLGAKVTIDSEQNAIDVLSNFSRISGSTLPIVLCFDEIDLSNNRKDLLESILKLNMIIKTQKLKNFLVILSVITDTWHSYEGLIESSLKAPINQTISLKPITIKQVKALWASRLQSLHQQAESKPKSNIAPFQESDLKSYFPSGKANPRSALKAGHELIQYYKTGEVTSPDPIASFQLLWQQELNQTKQSIPSLHQLSSAELAKMLSEVMEALQVPSIQLNLFNKNNAFGVSSFSYYDLSDKKIGLIWYEQPNLGSFCNLMKACEKLFNQPWYDKLVLIRAETVGKPQNKGYKLFQKIFQASPNYHIIPNLDSVHILATYHSLYSYVSNKNLTVGYETPDIARLQELTRECGIFDDCTLLKELELVNGTSNELSDNLKSNQADHDDNYITPSFREDIKEFVSNLVKTQLFIGRKAVTDKTLTQFEYQISQEEIENAIQSLTETNQIKIINPKAKREQQSLCLPTNKKQK